MPDTQNYQDNLEEQHDDSVDEDDVSRGIQEAEDFANKEQDGSGAVKGAAEKAASKGLSSAAAKATPWGRALSVLGFLGRHKKGTITGGSILSAIITMVMVINIFFGPVFMLLGLGKMMDGFNFGPGDRSVAGQVRHIKRNWQTIRDGNTEMSRKAQDIENPDRARDVSGQKVARQQKRISFRKMIKSPKRAPKANWGGTLKTADEPGQKASRRLYGTDSESKRTTDKDLGKNLTDDEMNKIADSENPRAASRAAARQFVGSSIIAGGLAAGCVASIAADEMPKEDEIYEYLLVGMSDFQSTVSQLADGDDVDQDQVVDVVENLHYTEEVVQASGEEGHISEEEEAEIQAEVDDIDQEIRELMEEQGVDDPEDLDPEGLAEREELIRQNENVESGKQIRSHTKAAAYKRWTNQEVTGNEIDADITFPGMERRVRQGPTGYLLGVGEGINWITGMSDIYGTGVDASTVCRFITNPIVGITLTGVDVVLTIKACAVTLGGGCAGRVALFTVTEALARGVSWAIMSLTFSSLAPEGPEELMGYIDMGTNMGESEYRRSQGAPPISNEQANAMRESHLAKLAEEDKEKGFAWRYFSPENHRSVFSNIAMNYHLNGFGLSDIIKPFTNFTATITDAFGRLFSPLKAQNEQNFNNYEIQQYGFTVGELRVDPLENAREVEEKLRCARGEEESGDNCTTAKTNEGEIMDELLEKCIDPDTSDPYYDMDEMCKDPSSEERDAWSKVGVWTLNSQIIDSMSCLSHDDLCVEQLEGGGSSDDDSSGESGDGNLMSHPNLGGPESNGYFRMPDAPSGEYTWLPGAPPSQRCGTRKLVNFTYTMAVKYHEKYPDAPLIIGDLNASGHLSHRNGVDVDIYGPDGYFTASRPMVSADKAIQLGKWMHDTGEVKEIYYNHREVQDAVNDYANNSHFMFTQPYHWNHFHVRLKDEYRGSASESC